MPGAEIGPILAPRRPEIEATQLACPSCHAVNARRSRRRSIQDYVLSLTGILPWRCEACETRFHGRPFPLKNLVYAHCGICGNLELQRISGHHVAGPTAFIGRLLGLPALRCAPCRHKFFSFRPVLKEHPAEDAARPVVPR